MIGKGRQQLRIVLKSFSNDFTDLFLGIYKLPKLVVAYRYVVLQRSVEGDSTDLASLREFQHRLFVFTLSE